MISVIFSSPLIRSGRNSLLNYDLGVGIRYYYGETVVVSVNIDTF